MLEKWEEWMVHEVLDLKNETRRKLILYRLVDLYAGL